MYEKILNYLRRILSHGKLFIVFKLSAGHFGFRSIIIP